MDTDKTYLFFVIFFYAFGLFFVPAAFSAVTGGTCSDCHTMHNSQNGSPMVSAGAGARWDGSNQLSGGSDTSPQAGLLRTDCVGCHSSSTASTIVSVGTLDIPIVFNTIAPVNPLAGGNFFWMWTSSDDTMGHNVHGISGQDGNLSQAPGRAAGQGCANSCHESLAIATSSTTCTGCSSGWGNGCLGCHHNVKHHGTDPAVDQPETAASGWYRFLGGPHPPNPGVIGIESADWEQNASDANHNVYRTEDASVSDATPRPISRLCTKCHFAFHSPGLDWTFLGTQYNSGGFGGDPWFRHPNDVVIRNTAGTEYSQIDGVPYNPTVPVGKIFPDDTTPPASPDVIQAGSDRVICLSCHRAHGSDQSDLLRWNYNTGMISHASGPNDNTGCFFCHREKDDL